MKTHMHVQCTGSWQSQFRSVTPRLLLLLVLLLVYVHDLLLEWYPAVLPHPEAALVDVLEAAAARARAHKCTTLLIICTCPAQPTRRLLLI